MNGPLVVRVKSQVCALASKLDRQNTSFLRTMSPMRKDGSAPRVVPIEHTKVLTHAVFRSRPTGQVVMGNVCVEHACCESHVL